VSLLLTVPFFLQALFHFFDEFHYHRKREPLPRWELWSHPVDTFGVLLLYSVCLFAPLGTWSVSGFVFLFLLSCFSVTKDEWVHKKHCSSGEQWLHALLFVIHPVTLLFAGLYGLSRFPRDANYNFLQGFRESFWIFELFVVATVLVLLMQVFKGAVSWKKA
jgi:hypothetical protein